MLLRSIVTSILLLNARAVVAQTAAPPPIEYSIKENYTKYEYRMPMRDGKNLFAAVYVPKDQSKSYPFLMERTPYSAGPYGVDFSPRRLGPGPEFTKAGYSGRRKTRRNAICIFTTRASSHGLRQPSPTHSTNT